MADVTWDDFEDHREEYTEADEEKAKAAGAKPIGDYLCDIVEVTPKKFEADDKADRFGCNLKYQIKDVLKIKGEMVESLPDPDAYDWLIGQNLFQTVFFYSENEPDWSEGQRKQIAKSIGLIEGKGDTLSNMSWRNAKGLKDIVVLNRSYKNSAGEEKINIPLFNGLFKKDEWMKQNAKGSGKKSEVDASDI